MIEHSAEFSDFPEFPSYEAYWAPVYMEPVVQSGERLTIAVVAHDGKQTSGQLAISRKALECLYGESASGLERMMTLALDRAIRFASKGFDGVFSSGMHGITMGRKRSSLGDDLEDVILQGISLTSSLSQIHAEESKSPHDRSTYWKRVQKAMERVDKSLVPHFGRMVDVSIKGSTISMACDYFSSRLAVNVCSLSVDYRGSQLFDAATSKVFKLEQLKDHDALLRHDQRATMMLVVPSESQIENLKPAAKKNFDDRILLLQDMADKRDFGIITVRSSIEGAKSIRELEHQAA
ncbi:hypothetical protein ACKI1H_27170 [Pseudomonas sp. YH-1]|uniref:hypothetical protein n=1 Tax=Pseudomonas sp. YH-1 TaxID=3384787 RepID=UPI003F8117D8